MDKAPLVGGEEGRLYSLSPDSTGPNIVYRGLPLKRPSDLAALDDGRVAVLDRGSPEGPLGAILLFTNVYNRNFSTLLPLRQEDGFRDPLGITSDRDGNLLIVDREANPNAYPAPNDKPGAVFRLNVLTRNLSLVATAPDWKEPVDAVVDRSGVLVVVDFQGGSAGNGALYEVNPGMVTPVTRELPSQYFRDPIGLAVDSQNFILISDPNSPAGNNPNGGAVIRFQRQGSFFQIATADTLLRQPADCAQALNGSLYITDREANPIGYLPGDRGAVFRLPPSGGQLVVAGVSQSLTQPDGMLILGRPDYSPSTLTVSTRTGQHPGPGDTVSVRLGLSNAGSANAGSVMAELIFSDDLELQSGVAGSGSLSLDRPNRRATWTGRLAMGQSMDLVLLAHVSPDAAYGEAAGATASIRGNNATEVTLSGSQLIRADVAPSQILVADQHSNLSSPGAGSGALFSVQHGERARYLFRHSALRQISALEWNPEGKLIIAANQETRPGAMYVLDPKTEMLYQFGQIDSLMQTPVDLCYAPNGDLFLVDRDAAGPTPGSTGAIFQVSSSGELTLFSTDPSFRWPTQMAFGPDSLIYLVDQRADPGLIGGDTGALFTIRPSDGAVLSYFQDPRLPEPSGIIAYDDSSMIVTDARYRPAGASYQGALYRWFPATGQLSGFVQNPRFRSPYRTERLPGGNFVILDRLAVGPGQVGSRGTLFGYDPVTRVVDSFAWSDSFLTLSDVIQKPGPLVDLASYDVEDANGRPLHPADRLRVRAVVRNHGPVEDEGVSFVDSIPPEASLIPGTAGASSGEVTATEGLMSWSGGIAARDSVVLTYDVQLNPAEAEGSGSGSRRRSRAPWSRPPRARWSFRPTCLWNRDSPTCWTRPPIPAERPA